MKKQTDPEFQYAFRLLGAIQSCFDENSDNFIDKKELENEDNLTHFLHALLNVMPTHVFNKITGNDKNMIELNHVANLLAFQYSTLVKDTADSTPDE